MSSNEEPENNAVDELEDDQVTLDSQSSASPEGGSEGESEAVEESATEPDLAAELEKVRTELAQAQEQALRSAAELQNVRRRAQQDVEKAHKFGVEKFANDMLPVADNLERSIDAASAEGAELSAVIEGVELTLKALADALVRHNVEVLDPEGEPFNPEFHQAMSMVPNPDVEPNTVLTVFQKGYTLNGRLVRPAMVVVSKAVD